MYKFTDKKLSNCLYEAQQTLEVEQNGPRFYSFRSNLKLSKHAM